MAPLPVLQDPDPRLRRVAAPVQFPDPQLDSELAAAHAALADFRTRSGRGRGLAATQLGIAKRFFVLHLGAAPLAIINPQLSWRSDETAELWDDCLSLPELLVRVRRHCSVSLNYQDERGRIRHWPQLPPDLAELVQHETDHLDGVLMTDRQSGEDARQPSTRFAELVGVGRPEHRLSLAQIQRAQQIIPAEFQQSPQYRCEPLGAALGCELTIKLEFTNPLRSFKGRGASFLVVEALRRGESRPLVCASAGNFGQAMAYACRAHSRPLTVFAAVNANALKVQRMRDLGAQVILQGQDFDAAKDAARQQAAQTGSWMVEDGLEPEISEGHGTIATELLARGDIYDDVVVPLGNGALLTGVGRWFKAASPATRIIGVCARGADAMARSWQSGSVVQTPRADTIADGIAVRVPIPEALGDMQGVVDEVLLVDDHDITAAMTLTHRLAGLQLEPAGASGLAALVAHPQRFAGRRVAALLCGSNLTPEQVKAYLHD
jgi:peptide deformylase